MRYNILDENGKVLAKDIPESKVKAVKDALGGVKLVEYMDKIDSIASDHAVPNYSKESVDDEVRANLDKANKQRMYKEWDNEQAAAPVGDVAYGLPYSSYVESVGNKATEQIADLQANPNRSAETLQKQQVLNQMMNITNSMELSDDEKLQLATKLLQKNPVNAIDAATQQIESLERIKESNPNGLITGARDAITFPGRAIGAGADAIFTDSKFGDSMANIGADDPLYARDEDGNTIEQNDPFSTETYESLGKRNWLSNVLQDVTRDPATPIMAAATPWLATGSKIVNGSKYLSNLGKGAEGVLAGAKNLGGNLARSSTLPLMEGALYEGLNVADEQIAGINDTRGRDNRSGGARIANVALGGLVGGVLGNATKAATDKMRQKAARTYMLNQGVPNKYTKEMEFIEPAVNTLDNKWDQNHMKQVNQEIGDLRKRDINTSVKPIKDNIDPNVANYLEQDLGVNNAGAMSDKGLVENMSYLREVDSQLDFQLDDVIDRIDDDVFHTSISDNVADKINFRRRNPFTSEQRSDLIGEMIGDLSGNPGANGYINQLKYLQQQESGALGKAGGMFENKYGIDWDSETARNMSALKTAGDPDIREILTQKDPYSDFNKLTGNFDELQKKNIMGEQYTGAKDINTVQKGIDDLIEGQQMVLDTKRANSNRNYYPRTKKGARDLLNFDMGLQDPRLQDIRLDKNGYSIPVTADDVAKIEPQDLLRLRSSVYDQTNFNKNKMQGTRAGDKANTLKARAITDYLYNAENILPNIEQPEKVLTRNKMYDKLFAQTHPLHKLIDSYDPQVNTYNPSDDVWGDALGSIATGNIMGSAGIIKNVIRNQGDKTRLLADLFTPKAPTSMAKRFPELFPESTNLLQTYMDKDLDKVIERSSDLQKLLTPDYGTNISKTYHPVALSQSFLRPAVVDARQEQVNDFRENQILPRLEN